MLAPLFGGAGPLTAGRCGATEGRAGARAGAARPPLPPRERGIVLICLKRKWVGGFG